MTENIESFRISIPDSAITDLQQRLAMARWPDAATVDDWSQGVPLKRLQSLCEYWQHQYDWRLCEDKVNRYPQFITTIDGLDIHFLHIRSRHANARPMVMTHGWPGSILEFMEVIEPLTDPTQYGGDEQDAFHLVLPSLPGYGFSGKPSSKGWGVERVASAWDTLMQRLGYSSYIAQGGDWGSAVTNAIGGLQSSGCQAIHINMAIAAPTEEDLANLGPRETSALEGFQFYKEWDSGYSKQQSTRPQTLGYALADSPVGQAAWIYEKLYFWTDNTGTPEDALGINKVLDEISWYWLTNTAASSARLYWESFNSAFQAQFNSDTPVGVSIFPKEIFRPTEAWVRRKYRNLIYWNETEKGGHFAAFEQPSIFVDELRKFARTLA
ncbi:epoxide hydrolase [Spongiibacter nanhainus]|uniref:Epoxide hydrolase n=1 Tax=Spongiibacter nanhainus TaxID=2794344 RepID=A0A7T4R2R2_9GAMM|nr:epoxide hydrolase family protein [Spongiibacter nanhainus]QQD19189.1 epoxide hydrolase [Spongiibacter nanhainus]